MLRIIINKYQKMNFQQRFYGFITKIEQEGLHQKAFAHVSHNTQIGPQEFSKMTPEQIIKLRGILLKKIEEQPDFRQKIQEQWIDCEKKLFNWLLFCYLYIHKKDLLRLNDQDYCYLAEITTHKSIGLLKYQTYSLIKQPARPKWSPFEDKLLYTILAVQKKYKTYGEWINVSKEMFLRGKQQKYKSSKNCRQRWFNHIDPSLNKQWSNQEDLKMMRFVQRQGKKWSQVIGQLNHTKSEHMIKNRYHSLLNKAKKDNSKVSETNLTNQIIQSLRMKISQKKQQKQINSSLKISKIQKEEQMVLIVSHDYKNQPSQKYLPICLDLNTEIQYKHFIHQSEDEDSQKASSILKLGESIHFGYLQSPKPVTPLDFFLPEVSNNYSQGMQNSFNFNMSSFINKNTADSQSRMQQI